MLLYSLFALALSAPLSPTANETLTNLNRNAAVGTELTTSSSVIGAIAIIFGLFLLFAGMRLFKLALFAGGFILFSNLAYWIMARVSTEGLSDTLMIAIPLVAGVIGGFIAYRLWKFGLSILGFLGGCALAMLLLSMKSGGLIDSQMGRIIFVLAFGIVGGIAIHFFEVPALIGSTSIAGAYSTVFGVDVFLKTGFAAVFQLFVNDPSQAGTLFYTADGKVIGMIAAVVVLTIIGCIAQYKANNGRKHR
jgi:hypothetical protein